MECKRGIAMRILSVCQTLDCDKTEEKYWRESFDLRLKKICYKVSVFENCQRQSCKVFIGLTIRAKNYLWGTSLLAEILGQTDRVGANSPIFTALHGMQTRSCDEISVCPSVCQTRALWQNGRKICPDFYTMRKIIQSSFMRRRMVGGGDPFYLKFWVNRPALERNRRFWTNNRS